MYYCEEIMALSEYAQPPQLATKENMIAAYKYKEIGKPVYIQDEAKCKEFFLNPKLLSLAQTDNNIKCLVDVGDEDSMHKIIYICLIKSRMLKCSVAKVIPLEEWNEFSSKHAKFVMLSSYIAEKDKYYVFTVKNHEKQSTEAIEFRIEFMEWSGFCYEICRFIIRDDGVHMVVQGYAALFEAYTKLCKIFPDNPEKVREMTRHLNSAHDASSASFTRRYLALKYDVVVLNAEKEFCRIQERDEFKRGKFKNVPLYWFNPDDFEAMSIADKFYSGRITAELRQELQEKLAIESEWQDAACVIKCEFPAGSAFLRCEVEPQKTRSGGGFEYLYLDNYNSANNIKQTAKYKADMSWVA